MKPPIQDGSISFDGPLTAADLRALRTCGAVAQLSVTNLPLITAAIAKQLQTVQSADKVWLWCTVTRAAMRYVASIPRLRVLDVLSVKNPGRLAGFGAAECLQEFRCNNCMNEDDLLEIASCKSLRQIGAQSAELTTKALKRLLAMPNLQSLDIEGTKFDDRMAKYIQTCESLEVLDIGATRLTRKGLEHIVKLPQIRSLDLWATRLEEVDLELLSRLPRLEYLSVGGCAGGRQAFNPDTLFLRLSAIPSLKRLWLDGLKLSNTQESKFEGHFSTFRYTPS